MAYVNILVTWCDAMDGEKMRKCAKWCPLSPSPPLPSLSRKIIMSWFGRGKPKEDTSGEEVVDSSGAGGGFGGFTAQSAQPSYSVRR